MKSYCSERPWRVVISQAVILLVLLMFVFPGVFLRGEMISPADMLFRIPPWQYYAPPGWSDTHHRLMADVVTAFQPYYLLTKQALQQGEWPLWNPLEFTGMPLLANCQTAVFYPPRLLHAAMDVHVATTLYIILKLWLCGMTALLCGMGIGLRVPSARFFSVGWMLASYNLIWCNWSLPDVSAWLPVVFLGVEWILDGRYRRGGVTLALGGTLLLLAGHPETAFVMASGVGLYFFARLLWERRRGHALWLPVLTCCVAWSVVLVVCAGQLLPFVEYLTHSAAITGRQLERSQCWLPPGSIVSLWLPHFFGTSREANFWGGANSNVLGMIYPGVAVWLLLALSFAEKRPRNGLMLSHHRSFDFIGAAPRPISLAFATFMCVLAGFQAPPLDKMENLPIIGLTRPWYYPAFATFALPLLGALGLEWWLSRRRRLYELGYTIPVILVAGISIGWLYHFCAGLIRTLRMNQYVNAQIEIAIVLTVVVLATLAIHRFRFHPSTTAGLLTLVLACDLIYANRGSNPTIERRYIDADMQLARFLKGLGPGNRFGVGEANIPSGLMVAYGLEEWLGYDGLYSSRTIEFHQRLKDDIWGAVAPVRSIQYFLNDPRFEPQIPIEKMRQMEMVATVDGLQVYRDPSAFPRAFLVNELREMPTVDMLFATMSRPDFNPKRIALTEAPPAGVLPHATASDIGSASMDERLSTRVRVTADAKEDCVLVLADAYYPGWKATIDGRPADLFPVYYLFRGLLLPAGHHVVEYTYMPWTFQAGMAISIAALVATSALSLLWLKRHRSIA